MAHTGKWLSLLLAIGPLLWNIAQLKQTLRALDIPTSITEQLELAHLYHAANMRDGYLFAT